jgi:hypothetical protein
MTSPTNKEVIEGYRHHFDNIFVGGIPKLFSEEASFLSFVTILTAIEALAGLMEPKMGTGERFKLFLDKYFPDSYKPHIDNIWKFRNTMVHSFSPGAFLITCHTSRLHLKDVNGTILLNAEDFFSGLLIASNAYFENLYQDTNLQINFLKRVQDVDGGAPLTMLIQQNFPNLNI